MESTMESTIDADVHTLEGNADAVEFCPFPEFADCLAAGSYTLQEGDAPTRLGGLHLFWLLPRQTPVPGGRQVAAAESLERQARGGQRPRMREVFRRGTAGVFDLKWDPRMMGNRPCLGMAGADGGIHLYALAGEGDGARSFEETATVACSPGAMCLSLDWEPAMCSQDPSESASGPLIITSQSDGALSAVQVAEAGLSVQSTWPAHSFEAWVAAFDRHCPGLVFSGGDDCSFCGWDIRADCHRPLFRDKNSHAMGVCSISSNPHTAHELVSGSYDEEVRVWDTRMLGQGASSRPLILARLGTGGGVWRLKWHPQQPELLLAALMHGGFGILRVSGGEVKMLERYQGHGSLAYGADWFRGQNLFPSGGRGDACSSWEEDLAQSIVATCSFYDRSVHLWRPSGSDEML